MISSSKHLRNFFGLKKEKKVLTYDLLNQRQLMTQRFCKHKIAVISLFFLISLYFVAVFAGFFAPYNKMTQNLDYIYSPPNSIRLSLDKGLYAKGLKQYVEPVELRKYYIDAPENDAPLGFFIRGDKYKFIGLDRKSVV